MAFDFKMPIGTPIHAAADGRVVLIVERFKDNVDRAFKQANYVVIKHDGGFISHYAHLTFQGVHVQVNDIVSRGDLIAYSGNTGQSDYPHLHFFVQKLADDCFNPETRTSRLGRCPQVPIAFFNADPADTILREGTVYTALPY
ncbi:MAG: M23 family metallopeptidase [Pseudomonadales bacterium]